MKRAAMYVLGTVLLLVAIRFLTNRMVCETEVRAKMTDASGLTYEVESTACDTLAKDEAVSVYVETKLSTAPWLFPKLRGERTLLFRYEPGKGDPLPSITRPSQSTIRLL